MEITYLGHSAFRLRGKDVTVVTDPFPPSFGLSMGAVKADVVTVSHNSPNHNFLDGVGNGARAVRGPGEYEVAGVLIAGVATAQEPRKGPTNTAYVLRFDELAICHLGDLDDKLTDNQVEALGSIDVLLIPVGGGKALGAGPAAEVVSQLGPSLVIPMHYRVEGGTLGGLDPVDLFCREMGSKEWVPEPKLTVTRGSLPSSAKVTVLEARGT